MENNNTKLFKLLLIGDQAVGKSCLLYRYVDNVFSLNLMGTAGIDMKQKIITIEDKEVKLNIYDSAGHDRFRSIAKNMCSKTDGIIIIYDITDKNTFESVNMWVKSITKEIESGIEVLLIGNKIDLVNQRVVSTEEGNELSKKYNIPFIETSAKESLNVEKAFLQIANSLYKKSKIKEQTEEKNNKRKIYTDIYSNSNYNKNYNRDKRLNTDGSNNSNYHKQKIKEKEDGCCVIY